MTLDAVQAQCELGQQQLMEMSYLDAEATLAAAERQAWAARDWDTLSRLYMPLQEARRQRRQRCGEGVVCLDLIAQGPEDIVEADHVVQNFWHGQLLVAGWGSIEPALCLRALQAQHHLYVETFLAAVYPAGDGRVIAIVPLEDAQMPDPQPRSIHQLTELLPPHSIVLAESDLPSGSRRGNPQTYAQAMALWERLHAPFLAAADAQKEALHRIELYRKTLRVDYACELAHQKLSDAARHMIREER